MMKILKAFQFELMPNGAQVRKMKRFCGCVRFVFNRALAYQNEQYQADKSFKFSYNKVANWLPTWKKDKALAWLKERNMVMPNEYDGAKDALKWAARTYLVAAIGSLAQLLYFVMIAMGRRE